MKRQRRALRHRRRLRGALARQPWAGPLLALALVVNGGALGYRITEGWDWGDCYWMVLITLSTLGFSDEHTPLIHTGGRIVTALLLVGGLVVVQQTIQKLLELTNSGYFRRLRERRYRQQLKRTMNQHVILCGYGRIGREIAEQLTGDVGGGVVEWRIGGSMAQRARQQGGAGHGGQNDLLQHLRRPYRERSLHAGYLMARFCRKII